MRNACACVVFYVCECASGMAVLPSDGKKKKKTFGI